MTSSHPINGFQELFQNFSQFIFTLSINLDKSGQFVPARR